ncbi:MAG: Aldo/keto reductase [Betaproteobacteria bacterium]|nr:Aldo/keto reductase [Betaproteobacteria bacterium]
MKYRRLGRSGPQVSAVSLGRGATPVRFGEPLEAEFNATIRAALDRGINFFDSSDAYWGTRHEVLLGRAIKGRRSEALVTSKFGNIDLPDGTKATNGRPDYVLECCEASLKRLAVDVIDVYYLHRVDPNVPIEETVGAMAQLISQGKVRFIGLCEAGVKTLKRAHREHPIAALQTEYSLWFRDSEQEILPACRELGIGYVAYAPLGRGLLTGRIKSVDDLPPDDRRRKHPRFLPENLAKNAKLVQALEALAARIHASPAQVALAWLLAQGEDIVAIPGTNHVANVEQNAAAAELRLDAKDLAELDELFAPGAGAGARYTDNVLKGVGL